MGPWTGRILTPGGREENEAHIDPEDIARLAEGRVPDGERRRLVRHLNRCAACYEMLSETLPHVPLEASAPWWKNRAVYALAASLVLVVLIGGNLMQRYGGDSAGLIVASLTVDGDLRHILMENDALYWPEGDRLDRLGALLRQRGMKVKTLKGAVLSTAYTPTKSMFGPKETLKVRIEQGIAYLEVVEEEP